MNWNKETTLYVGKMTCRTTAAQLKQHFGHFGEVRRTTVMRHPTGMSKGYGYVEFGVPSIIEAVLQQEQHVIDDRRVHVGKVLTSDELLKKRIFVKRLPPSLTLAKLRKYFSKFGIVNDAVIICDPIYNFPRTFGFITFDSEEAANAALTNKFHKPLKDQRKVVVEPYRLEQKNPPDYDFGPNQSLQPLTASGEASINPPNLSSRGISIWEHGNTSTNRNTSGNAPTGEALGRKGGYENPSTNTNSTSVYAPPNTGASHTANYYAPYHTSFGPGRGNRFGVIGDRRGTSSRTGPLQDGGAGRYEAIGDGRRGTSGTGPLRDGGRKGTEPWQGGA